VGTTNDNHCNIYLISLLLTVVINIWGVNCDIKTDFPKSSHISWFFSIMFSSSQNGQLNAGPCKILIRAPYCNSTLIQMGWYVNLLLKSFSYSNRAFSYSISVVKSCFPLQIIQNLPFGATLSFDKLDILDHMHTEYHYTELNSQT